MAVVVLFEADRAEELILVAGGLEADEGETLAGVVAGFRAVVVGELDWGCGCFGGLGGEGWGGGVGYWGNYLDEGGLELVRFNIVVLVVVLRSVLFVLPILVLVLVLKHSGMV